MKKTYFVRRDDEGKIFDKGFVIEGSTKKDETEFMNAVNEYLTAIYGEDITYFDGIIRVHCNAKTKGIDLRVFKSVFNENYKAAKNYAAENKEEYIEPAAELVEAKEKPAKKIATYTAKNTKKKKQRRIVQINKALDLLGEKCTLYTAIHCLSYVQNKKHRNGYFMDYVA